MRDALEPVRAGLAVLVESNEYDAVDCEDLLSRYNVANFGPHRQRGASETRREETDFNDVPQGRGTYKVDFGNVLGDDAAGPKLDHSVDNGLIVDPAEQATAEKRPMRIHVFRSYPLAGIEVDGHCLNILTECSVDLQAPVRGAFFGEHDVSDCASRKGRTEAAAIPYEAASGTY